MSNIFQPVVNDTGGALPLVVGAGPLVSPVKNQHLNLDSTGNVYASNAAITHYGAGLPFDANGRLVVQIAAVDRVDQLIPFTASNAVAVGAGPIDRYAQGLAFNASNQIVQN